MARANVPRQTDTNPRIAVLALLLSPVLPPAGPVLWAVRTLFLQLPLLDIQQSSYMANILGHSSSVLLL